MEAMEAMEAEAKGSDGGWGGGAWALCACLGSYGRSHFLLFRGVRFGGAMHISTAAAAAKDASSRRLINTCCGAMGLSAQGVGDEGQGGKEEQGAFYPCRFPMEES